MELIYFLNDLLHQAILILEYAWALRMDCLNKLFDPIIEAVIINFWGYINFGEFLHNPVLFFSVEAIPKKPKDNWR